jgi:hypothetical protein
MFARTSAVRGLSQSGPSCTPKLDAIAKLGIDAPRIAHDWNHRLDVEFPGLAVEQQAWA